MLPYRRSFDIQNAFPLLMTYRDTKSPQNELPNHLHVWVEIVYVYEGKGTFFIDNTFHGQFPIKLHKNNLAARLPFEIARHYVR
jgi:cupin superfamily acireductone dioxygenase involved in methionine salvage